MHLFMFKLVLFEERSKPFGRKKTVLHGGEGSISTIKWRGTFIAWANRKVRIKLYSHLIILIKYETVIIVPDSR